MTMIDVLADAAAATQPSDGSLSIYGLRVPGWALGVVIGMGGVVVILIFARKWLIPQVGGVIRDALAEYGKTQDEVNRINSARITNLAKGVINVAQASPEPTNSPELRRSAVAHATAALDMTCPDVTPPAPPTPENPQ
jgi:hypothetical protein